jgi:hypothetical protein
MKEIEKNHKIDTDTSKKLIKVGKRLLLDSINL